VDTLLGSFGNDFGSILGASRHHFPYYFVIDFSMNFQMDCYGFWPKMAPESRRTDLPFNPLFRYFSAGAPFDDLCAVLVSILASFWLLRLPFWHPFGRFSLHVGTPLGALGSFLAHFYFISVLMRIQVHRAPADNRRHLQRRKSSVLGLERNVASGNLDPLRARRRPGRVRICRGVTFSTSPFISLTFY
jgi:hypothetical protein